MEPLLAEFIKRNNHPFVIGRALLALYNHTDTIPFTVISKIISMIDEADEWTTPRIIPIISFYLKKNFSSNQNRIFSILRSKLLFLLQGRNAGVVVSAAACLFDLFDSHNFEAEIKNSLERLMLSDPEIQFVVLNFIIERKVHSFFNLDHL